ncbi:hypothetical protein [Streptomyces yunnanensis]|uniref:Uncharacterized protein n=1 Tax=Streptomyces yunnanensis TaxID=156453 RepID=A0A9X8R0K0_9ACTN|nr:hypothetical protein [Streptomyces yunnanensis]SHN35315.1 hypothetical protein SAMN05216268_1561 [Streptomyces yunnanensis]
MSVCTTPQASFTSPNHFPAQSYGHEQRLPQATPFFQGYPVNQVLAAGGQQQIPEFARQVAWALSTALVECANWIVPAIQANLTPYLTGIRSTQMLPSLSGPQLVPNWSNGQGISQTPIVGQVHPTLAAMGV